MSSINECPTVFCGCQSIQYMYPSPDSQLDVSYKLYLYILFVVVLVTLSVRLSLQWFIYKDYFPLKEKSPILNIIMVFGICVQLIIYPLVYSINYFTYDFTDPSTRAYFRAIQVGFEYSVYSVYLLRCLRISYAHQIDKSRRKSFVFKLFERENVLALCIVGAAVVRGLVVVVDPCTADSMCKDFAFGFEIASFREADGVEEYFIIRSLVVGFVWQLILIYCMLLHKNVNYRYSMKNQIALVLAATQITSLIHIITLAQTLNEDSTMRYLCNLSNFYPMTEFLRLINLLIAFVISSILPLFRKKVYHVLLPTGPHYGFVKTMRNFLMEKEFLRVFSKYLEYLDEEEGVDYYTNLLKMWQKIILLKIEGKPQEEEKLQSIITLVESVEDNDMLSEYGELITNLKGTITGLQDSELELAEDEAEVTRSIGEVRRQKFRESIDEKVNELEQVILEKLNRIYSDRYCYTESYFHLREIMNDYKKVNLNLIMLNMALIVDSEHEFS